MTQTYDSEWTPGPTALERTCPGMSVETIEYGYTDPLVDGSNPQTSADVGFVLPYVTSQTYYGTLSETIGYRYDDFFRLDAIRYAGETVELTYDDDGLLIGAGGFTLAYKGDNGLPLSVSDGVYAFTPVYNGFGEAISAAYDVNSGTGAFDVAVERDDTGQIMAKTETLDEDATGYAYAYYANGRLFTVKRDGQTSTDQHPSHTYALPGAYTVALTVTAPTGEAAKTRPDYIILTGKPPHEWHSADTDQDNAIRLPELLRAIQFYNVGAFHCQPGSADGYAPNPGDATCPYHDSDFAPPDWRINLSEVLRLIQFFNAGAYHPCFDNPIPTGDNFCPGPAGDGDAS